MGELDLAVFEALEVARSWHGGQFSALYSLASTGEIHGWEHQADLEREIEHNLTHLGADAAGCDPSADERRLIHLRHELANLEALLAWVKAHDLPEPEEAN